MRAPSIAPAAVQPTDSCVVIEVSSSDRAKLPSGWLGWRSALMGKWLMWAIRDYHRGRARRLVMKAERRARIDGWGPAVERLIESVRRHKVKANRWHKRYSGGR